MPAAERKVRVYFDFASTLCYVAHRVFETMADELDALGVALDWQPLDLADLLGWPRGVEVEPASTPCYVAHRVFGAMAAELDALGFALDWLPLDMADLLGWPRGVEV